MTLSRDYVQIIWGLHYHISLLTRISNYWTEYVFDIVNNGGRSWWASFISELTLLLPLSLYFLLTFTESHPPKNILFASMKINENTGLPLLFEILSNMCIAIVCFPGCNVINSEINLIFLIKPFSYMTKK